MGAGPLRVVALVLAAALFAPGAGMPAAAPSQPISVTFVGDSVPASLNYVAAARRQLAKGLSVKLDLRVCRRLATTGCPYMGAIPPSALEAVEAAGPLLGDVLVVDVGYNEEARTYREGMRELIRSATSAGVKGIVWVTLRESNALYRSTNAVIRSEARRWRQVYVADWNAYSAGRPWFGTDGLHLNGAGAQALVALVRPLIFRAARPS